MSRNKKCVTLDLKSERGQQLCRELAVRSDIVVENFRPGTLERWGLGPEVVWAMNPRVIFVRISGWGQTGPYARRPGYASVAEAMGGIRYVMGEPGRTPIRPNLSLGDTIAGLHAAFAALVAVYARDVMGLGRGQVVDVSLAEAVFNMTESMLPEYDKLGVVREPQGTKLSGVVPTNTYRCRDGRYVVIGGNGDSIFRRLMYAIGRPDLAEDPRLAHNDGRVAHEAEIDGAIEAWTREHMLEEVLEVLNRAEVPCGPIYSIADIVRDPHFQARGLFEEVELAPGDWVKIPAIVPFFSETPGRTLWTGPPLGAHNEEVYKGLLGLSPEELEQLKEQGVI